MRVALGIVPLGILLGAPIASAQTPDSTETPARQRLNRDRISFLDGAIETVRQDFAIPGLAVAIVDNGDVVYARGFGVRDEKSKIPVTEHTLFNVGSVTRTLTAAAVLQLSEKQQIALDRPITHYLPNFAGKPLSIAQLFHADDAQFSSVGAAIGSVTDTTYLQYMRTQVLDPAGMTDSTFDSPTDYDDVAWPHLGRLFIRRAPTYPWNASLLPSSGLNASVVDIARWSALHLGRDPKLLTTASYNRLLDPHSDAQGQSTNMGWEFENRGGLRLPLLESTGDGFSTLATLYRDQGRAIIILSNAETTPSEAIRTLIEAVLAGETVRWPNPPLLLRQDFKWSLAGLAILVPLLVAATLRLRRPKATS